MEKERDEIGKVLEDYARKYQHAASLESERNRLERELREQRYRLQVAERKVKELLQSLGVSEEELLKKALEAGDTSRLLQRKQELVSEINNLKHSISNLESRIAELTAKKDEMVKHKDRYEELKKKYDELVSTWNKRKQLFKDAFMEVFKNVSIPDFDPESMTLLREPYTYSQGERFFMAVAFQYALLSALKALGYEVPLVVIDLVAPVDSKHESEIIRVYRSFDAVKVLLKTADRSEVRVVT